MSNSIICDVKRSKIYPAIQNKVCILCGMVLMHLIVSHHVHVLSNNGKKHTAVVGQRSQLSWASTLTQENEIQETLCLPAY